MKQSARLAVLVGLELFLPSIALAQEGRPSSQRSDRPSSFGIHAPLYGALVGITISAWLLGCAKRKLDFQMRKDNNSVEIRLKDTVLPVLKLLSI